jgi:DNA-binding MurR/RpiR family transcriptional regulator
MSIQSTIEAALPTLSPSERRVAEAIRANPALVLDQTINEVAAAATTSVATVVRFCRAIGIGGYTHLRVQLAAELGKESAQFGDATAFGADIGREDGLPEAIAMIARLEQLAIAETIGNLDLAQIERVAQALDQASRVLMFGVSASFFVAEDLQLKLLRIGRNAFCPRDAHEGWELASLATPHTVAIAFSNSGETPETVRFADLARRHDARLVVVTGAPHSALARLGDEVVVTAAREPTLRAGAMVSRIAQLCVVDILFMALARLRYDDTVRALWLTRQALTADAMSPGR